jgi:cytochrome c oxidase assembly protein subunit 15
MNTASLTNGRTGNRKINLPEEGVSLPSKSLHVYAIVVACATFLLVVAGGLVTSTGSSLAVPDWPLSFGQFFPKMEGGVLYEHGHRMIAGTVGLMTFVLAGWLWFADKRMGVKLVGLGAAAAVILQAVLGGITVLHRLPPAVSIGHACLGQVFFCLTVAIAVLTGPFPVPSAPEGLRKLCRLGILTLAFIFLQLVAGATLRHTGQGLHAHLAGAALVLIHVQLLMRRVLQTYTFRSGLGRLAAAMPLFIAVQLVLGYISWRTGPVAVTTMHVGIGAFLFGATAIITLQAFRASKADA